MTHITMSTKMIDRINVLEKLKQKQIKQNVAASLMGISVRQTRRLMKAYRRIGAIALVHGNQGKASNRKIKETEIDRAMDIVKEKYYDFGPTFALEKLHEFHGVTFGVDTLRVSMIKEGIWVPKTKKHLAPHPLRERRLREGELVQIDGSPHDWFESRVDSLTNQVIDKCTLLVFIDDATSKLLWLEFAKSESTRSYFKATTHYLKVRGKPIAFYSDKHGVFRVNTTNGGSSDLDDPKSLTQFGRALKQLGIAPIYANTPQAKGRVENVNQTLQDRLVKELRLRNINNMEEANLYLLEFMKSFNQKFAVEPKSKVNAHRPIHPSENLELILAFHHQRVLSKNLSFQYKNTIYQITTKRPPYALRNAKVNVIENISGKVTIKYKERTLEYSTIQLAKKPEKIVDSKHLNYEVDQLCLPITQTVWEQIAEASYRDLAY